MDPELHESTITNDNQGGQVQFLYIPVLQNWLDHQPIIVESCGQACACRAGCELTNSPEVHWLMLACPDKTVFFPTDGWSLHCAVLQLAVHVYDVTLASLYFYSVHWITDDVYTCECVGVQPVAFAFDACLAACCTDIFTLD